jgi:MFS transporter, DHA3 family, tetracycline resistance protein
MGEWRTPYRVYVLLSLVAGLGMSLAATTAAIYRLDDAHLNPLQLVLVGTFLEVSYFACQVPTGLLADTYGRRRCVIAGLLVLGVGYAVEGSIATFAVIAAAQVVGALGHALIAGALEAWVADEFGDQRLGHVLLRGQQAALVGTLLGTAAAGFVASVSLRLPLLVGGAIVALLGLVLVAAMPETNFVRRAHRRGALRAQARETFGALRTLVRVRRTVLAVLGVVALYGASSEGFDRLWQAHLVDDVTLPALGGLRPVVWFSVLGVAAALVGIGCTELVRRAGRLDETRRLVAVLAAISAALSVAMVAFALAAQFAAAVAAYLATTALRRAYGPLVNTWMARQVEPTRRATLLSVTEMADAAGQFAGGPAIGAIGAVAGLRAALSTAGLVVAPAVAVLLTTDP